MRIISGKFKGRNLLTDSKCNFRPTTDRNREMIFSIIKNSPKISFDIYQAKVLDLFSGSGALSLESASRGAICATLVDSDQHHLQISYQNFSKIAPDFNVNFHKFDLTKKFPLAKIKHNLVFIDPPYEMNVVKTILQNAVKKNWIEKGALIVAEIPNIVDYDIKNSDIFDVIENRVIGKTKILFLRTY